MSLHSLYVVFRYICHQLTKSFKFRAEVLTKMCSILLYSLALGFLPCIPFCNYHHFCLSTCLSKSSRCLKITSELTSSTKIIAATQTTLIYFFHAPPTSHGINQTSFCVISLLVTSFTWLRHSIIHHIFSEFLLCADMVLHTENTIVSKSDIDIF